MTELLTKGFVLLKNSFIIDPQVLCILMVLLIFHGKKIYKNYLNNFRLKFMLSTFNR